MTTVPGYPTFSSSIIGDSQITLFWDPPESDGGSAIFNYTINLYDSSNNLIQENYTSEPGLLNNVTVTGLTNGTYYIFGIYATNFLGNGPITFSSQLTPEAPMIPPDAPTFDSAIAGNGQVTVYFTAPVNSGSHPILGYGVRVYDSEGNLIFPEIYVIGSNSPITVSGLTNGVGYRFTVITESEAGGSNESSPKSQIYTPMAPENPICYIGETKVLAKDIQTGVEAQVCAKDITPEKYLVYSSTQNKFVPVRVNCISGEVDKFILIKKDLLGENKPSEDFYVTASHPILYKNCEIEAKNIIGAKKATLEKQLIYTLVTDNREALAINNIDVLCWEYKAFMKRYKKSKNAVWIENENMSVINK
jgi:hypothetical protein